MESARSNASWVHKHASELALGAGGLVVLYGATKASVWLTSELLSISFTDVAWAGFWAGAFSAVAAGVAVNLMVRTATIRPERLYRAAMHRVQRSEAVQAVLGRKLEAGHLRAYVLHPGHVGFTDGKPGWVPPTVQMLYMVRGPDKRGAASEAMVTVEAVKSWPNRLQYKLLCVDPLDGPQAGEPIIVAGSEDRLHVRGSLRGFLQAERVRYIEQSTVENTADRMSAPPGEDGGRI